MNEEEALTGGNSNVVSRAGNTVRRNVGPYSRAVHELLKHLRDQGSDFTPAFLGTDEQGREILSYIAGESGAYPIKENIRSVRALEGSVAIMRRFHDMTQDLLNRDLPWARQARPNTEPEVICHYDIAPYNVIFQGSNPVAIIDWDNAGPGRRIDDIAYFAYRFAPLSARANYLGSGWDPDVDPFARLARIIELYPSVDRALLPELVLGRLDEMREWILVRARAGDSSVETHVREGHVQIYEQDMRFVEENRSRILAALSA